MNDRITPPRWVTAKLARERGPTMLGWTAALAFFVSVVLLESFSGDLAAAPSMLALATLLVAAGAALIRFWWLKRLAREHG